MKIPISGILILLPLFILFAFSCSHTEEGQITEDNLLASLNALEGVIAMEISPQNNFRPQ